MNNISYILKKINELPPKERVVALQANDYPAVRNILLCMFDENMKWLIPEGKPPYKPSQFDNPGALFKEIRKFNYFVEGAAPIANKVKREAVFIELLEILDPEEAELVIAAKDKKSPYKNITKKLVQEAFPGLFPT
jgi:hypothetical protein